MSFLYPLSLFGLAVLVMMVAHLLRTRRERLDKAAAKAAPAAKILIHSINDDRCTGCDACVAVCPTDVLELVENKSRVLRFGDCIQCEQCMFACPTQALVMHWEDDEPPPVKVPDLDPFYQTPIAGMYLIGEVAGKPLVKNGANAGRAVVEHMRREGLVAGKASRGASDARDVDVVIVGSGPAGLSAALTCLHHGFSYVILEKEQVVASTVARYPKGKHVMAEPYNSRNLSFLPVYDATKEEMVAAWRDMVSGAGLEIRLGEAVEQVKHGPQGFEVRSTVARYTSRRVVLATGTRGKPRTLGVPGENLAKVSNLLDDPEAYRGQDVLVVGGGDSAVEAACALAEAGARVLLSYRGKQFNRAQAANRDRILRYGQERRVGILLGSSIIAFTDDTVELKLPDGQKKRVPNRAAFVLIGADPPVAWLESLGVTFSERPHWYALGATDQLVESLVGRLTESPRDVQALLAALGRRAPVAVPARDLAPVPEASIMKPLPKGPSERPRTLLGELSAEAFAGRPPTEATSVRPGSALPRAGTALPRATTLGGERHGRNKTRSEEETRLLRSLRDDNARQAFEEPVPVAIGEFPMDDTGANMDLRSVEDPRNWFADLSGPVLAPSAAALRGTDTDIALPAAPVREPAPAPRVARPSAPPPMAPPVPAPRPAPTPSTPPPPAPRAARPSAPPPMAPPAPAPRPAPTPSTPPPPAPRAARPSAPPPMTPPAPRPAPTPSAPPPVAPRAARPSAPPPMTPPAPRPAPTPSAPPPARAAAPTAPPPAAPLPRAARPSVPPPVMPPRADSDERTGFGGEFGDTEATRIELPEFDAVSTPYPPPRVQSAPDLDALTEAAFERATRPSGPPPVATPPAASPATARPARPSAPPPAPQPRRDRASAPPPEAPPSPPSARPAGPTGAPAPLPSPAPRASRPTAPPPSPAPRSALPDPKKKP